MYRCHCKQCGWQMESLSFDVLADALRLHTTLSHGAEFATKAEWESLPDEKPTEEQKTT